MNTKNKQTLENAYQSIINESNNTNVQSEPHSPTKVEENLKKFKKDFEKLLSKYSGVSVGSDINGNLFAHQQSGWKTEQINLPSYFKK
jgi:hypothetical protein